MSSEIKNIGENFANWKADAKNTPDGSGTNNTAEEIREETPEAKIRSSASKLCEYITGLKPEDPKIIEKLFEDQRRIRAKYSLPNLQGPLSEIERSLKNLAKTHNVKIRAKHEYAKFFQEVSAAAVYDDDTKTILSDVDRNSIRQAYYNSLTKLEHELIHALQDKYAHSMPIEIMEYEAYLASANLSYLKQHKKDIEDVLFHFFIEASVKTYYRLQREKTKEVFKPEWEDPAYSVNKDGV